MIDDYLRRFTPAERLAGLGIKRKPYVLHRADFIFFTAPLFKTALNRMRPDPEVNRLVDAEKF